MNAADRLQNHEFGTHLKILREIKFDLTQAMTASVVLQEL